MTNETASIPLEFLLLMAFMSLPVIGFTIYLILDHLQEKRRHERLMEILKSKPTWRIKETPNGSSNNIETSSGRDN